MKSFDGVLALNDLSIAFEESSVTALIGPNGAGKTTLLNLIAGALRPDAGQILYCGKRIDGLPPWRVARRGIGRLFQDVRVFGRISVIDNVLLAFGHQAGENPLWVFARRSTVTRQESNNRKVARQLLELVALTSVEKALAETLSRGQQKLLAIARLLAAGGDLLLLDEPTAGISPDIAKVLLRLIRRLAEDEHKTIVVIEHDMAVVRDVANRVNFLDAGRIVAAGSPSEVLNDRRVRAIYLGL